MDTCASAVKRSEIQRRLGPLWPDPRFEFPVPHARLVESSGRRKVIVIHLALDSDSFSMSYAVS